MASGGICTKKGCEDGAAEDSVQCARHRDIQREKNAKYQGRADGISARAHKPRASAARDKDLPAIVGPPSRVTRPVVVNGSTMSLLNEALAAAQADVEALVRARAIVERHRASES